MTDYFARVRERHQIEVAAGQHDARCEWRDAGHFLCLCAKRRRLAAGRTEAPTLLFSYPTCDGCDDEVTHNGDSWECLTCGVIWPSGAGDGVPGTWTDDHGEALDTSRWDDVSV